MTTLKSLDPDIREALSYHYSFVKLGYSPENIFLGLIKMPIGVAIQVILEEDGKKFACDVGVSTKSREELSKEWTSSCEKWNSSTNEERKRVWESSHVFKHSVEFVTAMVAKGFSSKRSLN